MAITLDIVWPAMGASSTTAIVTSAHTPGAGCTLLLAYVAATQTVNSITDTHNTWTLLPVWTSPNGNFLYLGYVVNPVITSTAITANLSATGQGSIGAGSFLGTAAVPYDKSASNTGLLGTALDSGNTATTTFANEVLIGIGMQDSSSTTAWTVGAGYSSVTNWTGGPTAIPSYMTYQIVSSTGAYNATETSDQSKNWLAAIATFSDTNIPAGNSAPIAWVY